jgi:hypothetical protein
VPSIEKIFELAQRAHSLYLTRKTEEQAQLLKKVVLNYETDGVSLYPTYRKPFDLIFKRAKNEEWSALEDDLRTFLLVGIQAAPVRPLLC